MHFGDGCIIMHNFNNQWILWLPMVGFLNITNIIIIMLYKSWEISIKVEIMNIHVIHGRT